MVDERECGRSAMRGSERCRALESREVRRPISRPLGLGQGHRQTDCTELHATPRVRIAIRKLFV